MTLTTKMFEAEGVLDALATIYSTAPKADGLLGRIDVSTARLSPFGYANPRDWWRSVCRELEHGLVPGGLERLIAEAARDYPGQPRFRLAAAPTATAGGEAPTGALVNDGVELSVEEIDRLVSAAIDCGIARSSIRRLLMSGLPDRFVDGLAEYPAPYEQLVADLQALNKTPQLEAFDRAPLAVWLENAIRHAGPRMQAGTFREALRKVDR